MDDELIIDPWGSSQSTDYDRIISQFGLQSFSNLDVIEPSKLHRRGIIFAHRDLDVVMDSISMGKNFGVMTGLMPSGQMHLGHSMVVEQVKWFQEHGADVNIAVADLESQATRGISLEKGREIALAEYVANYAALGLDPEKVDVYFQSSRHEVQRLGFQLGKKTNLSEFEAIYGFNGQTNLAHVQAPLVQAGDILHPQLDEFGGLRPIVVPVGVDQDPHIRLTRGLAGKTNWFNVKPGPKSGLVISLSVQDENAQQLGVLQNGRVDKGTRNNIFNRIKEKMAVLGFSDIISNPKHGTISLPSAVTNDKNRIKMKLLELERSLGGPGLMSPSSTYHHFAVGLTGNKMSSSKPKTTIFLRDDLESVKRKIMKSFSGGQPTLEEHRRLGGNPDIDVAYQYMMYFFEDDDSYLSELNAEYRAGKILAGEMKQICADKAEEWMSNVSEMRDQTNHLVAEFLAHDAR